MAVNGVYRNLSSTSLYGQNLTWGFASAIGHNYQSTSRIYLPYGLYEVASFDWENASAQSLTGSIWATGYNVIANCNDIIQQVISKDTSFFGEGKMEKDMILGEMYGVRALVHFDLFRLFCPAPITQNTGRAIPYVTKYPDLQPSYQDAPAFMDSVIMDMTRAQSLLAVVDTVFNRRQNTSVEHRVRSEGKGLVDSPDDFFLYRATRMNYFAANALLARMYADEEWRRVELGIGAVRRLAPGVLISVDTFRSEVAARAIEKFGPLIINDISAGELDPQMPATAARCGVPYVAMHMKGDPRTMQTLTDYKRDITAEVTAYFETKTADLLAAGIKRENIILDPGFGFAKTTEQNYELLAGLHCLCALGYPVLAGLSRKSMIYRVLDATPAESLAGTVALGWECLRQGAAILRVHDVQEAVDTVRLFDAYERNRK